MKKMIQTSPERIKDRIRDFILKEFLPAEDCDFLTDDAPLITGGILDSLAATKLIAFIEEHYDITLQANEVDVRNLNSVSKITQLVISKLSPK
jgi:acyl carrier protein